MPSTSIASPTQRPTPPADPPSYGADAFEEVEHPHALVVVTAGQEYGIAVEQVREVARSLTVTRVPGAPPTVRGIINVRGAVVTVLDLSVLLETGRAVTSPSVVLLQHGTRLIGLAVDAVLDVRAVVGSSQADDVDDSRAPFLPLDAVALCAPHLLSSEEMGR